MESKLILAVNSGSSTLKFALFRAKAPLEKIVSGYFDRIGLPGSIAVLQAGADCAPLPASGGKRTQRPLGAGTPDGEENIRRWELRVRLPNHRACVPILARWLRDEAGIERIDAVGHRITFGGPRYGAPCRVGAAMIQELSRLRPLDPEHLPPVIATLNACRRAFSGAEHVACFDTYFHRDLPRVARILPIPARFERIGVRKYGFHGLSFAYLLRETVRIDPKAATQGRVLLAHLGSGASLAAVRAGVCVDTSMAFTPNSGLVMSSRSGDLDPGVVCRMAAAEGLSPARLQRILSGQSGLLGISGRSADMRELLAAEAKDPRSAEAVAVFCYQARKWIGAFAAALGGLDLLVFSGGIGEHSPVVRERICSGLEFLGVELDASLNRSNAGLISDGKARVRIIATDEERMIVESVQEVLDHETNR